MSGRDKNTKPNPAESPKTTVRLSLYCFALTLAIQLPFVAWLTIGSAPLENLHTLTQWLQWFLDPNKRIWLPLALSLGLSTMITWFFHQRITAPLKKLTSVTQALSNHNYEMDVNVEYADDVGQLAYAQQQLIEYLRLQEQEVSKLAYEDSLTGLNNRAYFLKIINQILNDQLRAMVVIVWSIDRFKVLNSVLGFAAGDHLLRALGLRFKSHLTDAIVVARLSSTSFAVGFELLENTKIDTLVNKILNSIQEPLRIYGQPIELSATCGVAIGPKDGNNAADLMRRAEIAQTIAHDSKQKWVTFQNNFEVQSSARLSMLSELRAALESKGQLQLFLQPKLNLKSGTIDHAEALVRWQHPQRGLVMPGEFIPFAEQTGRIYDITLWAIEEALQLIDALSKKKPICISVNVSAFDLQQPSFAEKVIELLVKYSINPNMLCLEITESNAMENPTIVLETLKKLHAHQITLAIDDFGSGYSSLSYMKRFPVHELKIDRALVAGVRHNTDSETILRCTIELGHLMGMHVTAEGVETMEEFSVLKRLNVDYIQGYLIGKAMPLELFKAFCNNFKNQEIQNNS